MFKVVKAAGLIIAMVAIYYAAQALTAIAISIFIAVKVGVAAGISGAMPDVQQLTEELLRQIGAQTPWIIIVAVAISLPTFYLFYQHRRQELLTFVSVRGLSALSVPVLVLFALSVNVLVELLLVLLESLPAFSGAFEAYEQLAGAITGGGFVMTLIAVGVIGPVFEEILFRGLVFGELRKIMRVRPAILVQAALFGIYHMNLIQGAYALLIGLLLGYVYYRCNSIIAPAIIHIVINSSSVIISYAVTQGQLDRWNGVIVAAGAALFLATGAFLLLGRSFRRCMDDSLYEQNRLPKPQE